MTAVIARSATLPVARSFPVVGAIPDLLREQVAFLEHARVKYGDIYKLNAATTSLIILNRPEHAQHVFRDHVRNYPKEGQIWEAIRGLVGNGLVLSSGDFWLRQRRMMQPQFHRQRLGGLTQVIIDVIAQNLQDWNRFVGEAEPRDIHHEFVRLNMTVVMRTMFGADITDEDTEMMSRSMALIADQMLAQAIAKPIPSWIPVPRRAQFQQALDSVGAFVKGIIEKRRQHLSNDLISMLLEAADDESGDQMTDQQVLDEVITIFAAHETTALTMTWMTYFLTQHPAVVERLRAEADTVLGDRLPTFEDLPRLTYTRQVFQETLRLCPPVYFLPRVALEDDEIDGYHIPAGQMVAVAMYTIQRHPDFWKNPDAFDPDHFAPDQTEKRHPMAWIPFGAGQRICIGRDFAYMEGALILAMLMQRFEITAPDNFVTKPRLLMTLHPDNGVLVHLNKR